MFPSPSPVVGESAPWRSKYYSQPAVVQAPVYDLKTRLRNFAQRAFSTCSTDDERSQMEQLVKRTLLGISAEDMNSIDWETYPIPTLQKVQRAQIQPELRMSPSIPLDKPTQEKKTIVGTSTSLEKAYFRLTSEANPEDVRPPHILRKAFETFCQGGSYDKLYVLEQFKSIRQDLAIQNIKDNFCLEIYEHNARFALRNGFFDDFVQCIGQTVDLYDLNLQSKHKAEFTCCHMMYLLCIGNMFDFNLRIRSLISCGKLLDVVESCMNAKEHTAALNIVALKQLSLELPELAATMCHKLVDSLLPSFQSALTRCFKTDSSESVQAVFNI